MFTPPRDNTDIHAALSSVIDETLDSLVDVMLNSPTISEYDKYGLRLIKANCELKYVLRELINLSNPKLDTTDALFGARVEVTAFLTRTLDEAKILIEKHSALIDKSKEL